MVNDLEHKLWWAVLCYFVVGFAGALFWQPLSHILRALFWHPLLCTLRALFWHPLLRIFRALPGVGDDEEPITLSVSAGMGNSMFPWAVISYYCPLLICDHAQQYIIMNNSVLLRVTMCYLEQYCVTMGSSNLNSDSMVPWEITLLQCFRFHYQFSRTPN